MRSSGGRYPDREGASSDGTGIGEVGADSSTASRSLSFWSFASAPARSFSSQASRVSSLAIAWRRERLSGIGQGLPFSVSTTRLAEVEHPFDETDYVCLDLVIGAPQEKVGNATGASAVVIEEIAPQHLDCLFCLGVS